MSIRPEDKMILYNYVTGERLWIPSPDDYSDYVPQENLAQYKMYIEQGLEPIKAKIQVMKDILGLND